MKNTDKILKILHKYNVTENLSVADIYIYNLVESKNIEKYMNKLFFLLYNREIHLPKISIMKNSKDSKILLELFYKKIQVIQMLRVSKLKRILK